MSKKNFREVSRMNLVNTAGNFPDNDQIQLGCLQRIADATELMAKNYQDLVDERDKYIRWYESSERTLKHLEKCNSALRGVITKLKKGKL